MSVITNSILFTYFKYRQSIIEKVIEDPVTFQKKILQTILGENKNTNYGRKFHFKKIRSYEEYRSAVPIVRYEDIFPYIDEMLQGKSNVLCHEKITWFSKSSGTSNNRSKFIPVSLSYLNKGHLKCAWDAASFIYHEDPKAKLFKERSLIMGGSLENRKNGIITGDVSAIILKNFPKIGRRFYTPDFDIALMKDWKVKIEKMAHVTAQQNVTLLAGVPTWTIVLLREILKQTGKNNISEVWPNLRSYLHGGVGFEPYREIFNNLLPSNKIKFREVYNASEGYFAIQNNYKEDSMLLLCDHQIFYEFIKLKDWRNQRLNSILIQDVEIDVEYVILISNTSGLYRYVMG